MDLLKHLIVLSMVAICCAKFIFARNKSPLIDEEGNKINSKGAECVFGKQVRELGSKWIPDLGPPIGVLYCMQCECVKKKRKIVARVQCHNIINECPVPTCPDPIVVEGRCCKTCPGDTSPDVIQDIIPQNVEDEEKNNKHYVALLTRRSSLTIKNENLKPFSDATQNNVVASGRFTFHKKNLYYSFYISEKAARPQSLQFVDSQGNILEEVTMSYAGGYVNSVYQNASRKVCGVWKRVAKEYKKIIRQEKMYATLVWGVKDQAEFTLSGKLMRHNALNNEMLSSLLEPAPGTDSALMTGTGGTAIVSTHTTITPSINIAIIFNGLFTATETSDNFVNITLSMEERKQLVVQGTVRVAKPSWDLNVVNITAIVSQSELRFLTRGHMLLSISSVSMPGALKLSGNVITKATCELFQSTLTSTTSSYNSEGVSGIAWLYLNNAGSLVYNIQIDNLPPEENPPFITLNDMKARRKTELEEITPFFIEEGWFTGVIDKLSPKVLEPLYNGDLTINVATKSNYTLIKGRLIAKYVADARDAPVPALLKREEPTLPVSVVGMAWISLDTDCHLHYDVSITGLGNERKLSLMLEFYPLIAPGAPHINRLLDEFQGNSIEDNNTVEVLTKEEVSRLDGGVTLLKIKDYYSQNVLLKASLPKVPIPINCKVLTPQQNNNVQDLYDNPALISTGECLYEGRFYAAETSWVTKNPCQMCFCQNGKTKCDTMTCPPINCTSDSVFQPLDECCPICINNSIPNENSKCLFNGRSYSPGSKFHPFLIPTGFDLCTVCYCDSAVSEIRCSRLNDDENSCCKNHNCNKKQNENNNGMYYDDVVISVLGGQDYANKVNELLLKTMADKVLAEGGCKNPNNIYKPYLNGSEFHPTISTLGEYKCVTCKCLKGKSSCSREQCDAATCKKIIHSRKKKQKLHSQNACCSVKQCRKLRHKKKQNTLS